MKKIVFTVIVCALINNLNYSQAFDSIKKDFSLYDAVLGYYKGLYPDNLSGLQWTKNDKIVYKKNDSTFLKHYTKYASQLNGPETFNDTF